MFSKKSSLMLVFEEGSSKIAVVRRLSYMPI